MASALLAMRRSQASIEAASVAGAALTVWIVAEVAMLRSIHWLHVVYGAVGLSLLGLGVHAGWRSRLPRQRWLIAVTLADTLGFLAPACAIIVSFDADAGD